MSAQNVEHELDELVGELTLSEKYEFSTAFNQLAFEQKRVHLSALLDKIKEKKILALQFLSAVIDDEESFAFLTTTDLASECLKDMFDPTDRKALIARLADKNFNDDASLEGWLKMGSSAAIASWMSKANQTSSSIPVLSNILISRRDEIFPAILELPHEVQKKVLKKIIHPQHWFNGVFKPITFAEQCESLVGSGPQYLQRAQAIFNDLNRQQELMPITDATSVGASAMNAQPAAAGPSTKFMTRRKKPAISSVKNALPPLYQAGFMSGAARAAVPLPRTLAKVNSSAAADVVAAVTLPVNSTTTVMTDLLADTAANVARATTVAAGNVASAAKGWWGDLGKMLSSVTQPVPTPKSSEMRAITPGSKKYNDESPPEEQEAQPADLSVGVASSSPSLPTTSVRSLASVSGSSPARASSSVDDSAALPGSPQLKLALEHKLSPARTVDALSSTTGAVASPQATPQFGARTIRSSKGSH